MERNRRPTYPSGPPIPARPLPLAALDAATARVASGDRSAEGTVVEAMSANVWGAAVTLTRAAGLARELDHVYSIGLGGILAAARRYDRTRGASGGFLAQHAAWLMGNEIKRIRQDVTAGALHPDQASAPDQGDDVAPWDRVAGDTDDADLATLDLVRTLLARCHDKRARYVLVSHYGVGGAPKRGLHEMADILGVHVEEVMAIERDALERIRSGLPAEPMPERCHDRRMKRGRKRQEVGDQWTN